jgi:hypothetical protein
MTHWSLGAGTALHAGRLVQATHEAQVAAMSSLWLLLGDSTRSLCPLRCVAFGRSEGVTHKVQVTAMSSWWLLPGSSTCSSCPPRCACIRLLGAGNAQCRGRHDVIMAAAPWELCTFFVPTTMCRIRSLGGGDARGAGRHRVIAAAAPWKLRAFTMPATMCSRLVGTGDARHAGHRDVVVAVAPWELHAFFVPAVMCPCLVARHRRRTTHRLHRSSARSLWFLPWSSMCSSYPPQRACIWLLSIGNILHADRAGRWRGCCGSSLGAPRVRRACCDVLAFGRSV